MPVEITKGDITRQPEVGAVVNAANSQLAPGGGVAGAIHRAAGPELYEEARKLAPVEPGECVVTKAYGLPNDYVIHCLGPRYGIDEPAEELLARCHAGAIELAEEHRVSSVAFPAISTGAFGYPTEQAAPVALRAVKEALKRAKKVKQARFVLFSEHDFEVFQQAFEEMSIEPII